MTFVTVPATYSNGVITMKEAVQSNPVNVIVTLEYSDLEGEKNIDKINLAEYLESDEYKNDTGVWYMSPNDFLADLKQYKN